MTFLAPAVLAGAAAIAAPIAIHLLNKTRVKVMRWAAIRFLQDSLQKNRRRLQIEDLVLLLLRCAFITLLVLAFALLVLNPDAAGEGVGSGPLVAVVIVDQSASMGQSNGFRTLFDEAKSKASQRIAEMPAGSQVALFLAADRISQAVPRPTANLPLVRRILEVSEPTDSKSDLTAAVRLALETLKPFSGSRKEILVFSDHQASAWPELEKIRQMREDAPEVKLTVVDPGPAAGGDNLAITRLEPESALHAVGRPAGFLVEVSHYGTKPVHGIRVTLGVDDDPPGDEMLIDTLGPGESKVIRLHAKFPETGFFTVRAAIPADRMPVDNERATAVRVRERRNVAVIEGASAKDRDKRDAFFLVNALAPIAPTQRADYYLKIETRPMAWLQSGDLSNQEVIFLANVETIGADTAKRLEEYVRKGGMLVVFPGARANPAALNADPTLAALLPAKLGPRNDLTQNGKSLTWQAENYTHPVTALWNDPNNGSLGSVRATAWFPLTPVPPQENKPGPRTVVKFSDGSPAVLEAPHSLGRVVLFSTASTPDGTNFPLHPNFVPFLQRLLAHLAPDTAGASLTVSPGSVFQTTVSSDLVRREVSVIAPAGKGQPRPVGKIEAGPQGAVLRFSDTAKVGPYRFLVAGRERVVATCAVQMDPTESDLRILSPEQRTLLTGQEADPSTPGTLPAATPVRREFWGWFLGLAFAAFLVEMVLAHRFSFSR